MMSKHNVIFLLFLMSEIELPRPEKRGRAVNENMVQSLQNRLLVAVNHVAKPPAKVTTNEPIPPEVITHLAEWARRFEYVLHYKEKKKWFNDVPGDVRHEGREAMVYTIELYWAV